MDSTQNVITADADLGDAPPSPYFSPRRIGHVNIWVENVQVSEAFYRDCCGLNVEFTEPDLVASFLGTGHTPHDLGLMETTKGVDRYGRNGLLQLPGTIGLRPGLNHLAWELQNEKLLVEGFRRLKQDGVATDMTVDHQVAHSVYVFDPEGNYNEFYCDTIKDWRAVLGGPMELITSAWDPLTAGGFEESRFEENPPLNHVETALVHPHRLTHAVLYTSKLADLERFYTKVAGLRVVGRSQADGMEAVYLAPALPEYQYNLVLLANGSTGFGNSAFELLDEESFEAALTTLRANGIEPVREISLPWKRALHLTDPDGLLSEYYVRRPAAIDLALRGNVPLELAL